MHFIHKSTKLLQRKRFVFENENFDVLETVTSSPDRAEFEKIFHRSILDESMQAEILNPKTNYADLIIRAEQKLDSAFQTKRNNLLKDENFQNKPEEDQQKLLNQLASAKSSTFINFKKAVMRSLDLIEYKELSPLDTTQLKTSREAIAEARVRVELPPIIQTARYEMTINFANARTSMTSEMAMAMITTLLKKIYQEKGLRGLRQKIQFITQRINSVNQAWENEREAYWNSPKVQAYMKKLNELKLHPELINDPKFKLEYMAPEPSDENFYVEIGDFFDDQPVSLKPLMENDLLMNFNEDEIISLWEKIRDAKTFFGNNHALFESYVQYLKERGEKMHAMEREGENQTFDQRNQNRITTFQKILTPMQWQQKNNKRPQAPFIIR